MWNNIAVALATLVIIAPSFAQPPKTNAPQLLRGCEVLGNLRETKGPEDAVHAAYCLGLIDGAANHAYLAKVKPNGIPQFCPPDESPDPREIAARIANVIKARDLGRTESYGRGTSGMVALAMSYPCR